jgi:hypothetical protein
MIPDDFSAARTQTLLVANTQYASIMDRLIALRGGAKGLSLAGLNVIVDGKMVPLAQLEDMAKQLFGGGASADEKSADERAACSPTSGACGRAVTSASARRTTARPVPRSTPISTRSSPASTIACRTARCSE